MHLNALLNGSVTTIGIEATQFGAKVQATPCRLAMILRDSPAIWVCKLMSLWMDILMAQSFAALLTTRNGLFGGSKRLLPHVIHITLHRLPVLPMRDLALHISNKSLLNFKKDAGSLCLSHRPPSHQSMTSCSPLQTIALLQDQSKVLIVGPPLLRRPWSSNFQYRNSLRLPLLTFYRKQAVKDLV